jgi:hypothetical protein
MNSLWKVSVLLRLGYTQRNVVEGFMRSVAVMGLVATNPKAMYNAFPNAKRYVGMKRGLKIHKENFIPTYNLVHCFIHLIGTYG